MYYIAEVDLRQRDAACLESQLVFSQFIDEWDSYEIGIEALNIKEKWQKVVAWFRKVINAIATWFKHFFSAQVDKEAADTVANAYANITRNCKAYADNIVKLAKDDDAVWSNQIILAERVSTHMDDASVKKEMEEIKSKVDAAVAGIAKNGRTTSIKKIGDYKNQIAYYENALKELENLVVGTKTGEDGKEQQITAAQTAGSIITSTMNAFTADLKRCIVMDKAFTKKKATAGDNKGTGNK